MHEGCFLKNVCFHSLSFLLTMDLEKGFWHICFHSLLFLLTMDLEKGGECRPFHVLLSEPQLSQSVLKFMEGGHQNSFNGHESFTSEAKAFFSLKIWQKMMAFIKPVEDIVPPCLPSVSSDTDVIKSSKRCHHWNLCQVCVGINRHQTSNADVVVIQCNVMQWGIVFGPVDQIW